MSGWVRHSVQWRAWAGGLFGHVLPQVNKSGFGQNLSLIYSGSNLSTCWCQWRWKQKQMPKLKDNVGLVQIRKCTVNYTQGEGVQTVWWILPTKQIQTRCLNLLLEVHFSSYWLEREPRWSAYTMCLILFGPLCLGEIPPTECDTKSS